MDISRRQAIILIVVVVAGIGFLVVADQFIERISPWDYDDFERWMRELGAWGPILYILFFAVSMVIAPIPTGPAPIAAAAAFGGVEAFFYTMLAGTLGATLCFGIARKWGRPALERFLPDKLVSEIDRVSDHLGVRVLFMLRLFPIFGVDIVSYGAGLTRIRFTTYLLISIVATTPVLVLVSVVGEGLREDKTVAAVALAVLAVFLLTPLLYFALRRRRTSRADVDRPGVGADQAAAPPSGEGPSN
jgi:uncharacterized membrane protein YdjX (TVP38/TMEM64 family)